MRFEAISRLTDQNLLVDVAKNGEYKEIRILAADKLNDRNLIQAVLADVAENDEDSDIRQAAADRLAELNETNE